MAGGRELFASDLGDEAGGSPDANAGHAPDDGFQRIRRDELGDLDGDLRALATKRPQLLGETRQHGPSRVRAANNHRLLGQSLEDFLGQTTPHARGELDQAIAEPGFAGGFQRGRVFLEEV